MQQFYKKALLAFVLIVLADALLAVVLVERSYLSLPLLLGNHGRDEQVTRWHFGSSSIPWPWEAHVIRIDETARDSLRFDTNMPLTDPDGNVSGDLLARDGKDRPVQVDMSKYDTISFVARCAPASSLSFIVSTFDERSSQSGKYLTYPPAMTFFSCNDTGVPVTLDLTRLTVPEWWLDTMHRDVSHQEYSLDRVERLVFSTTGQSPRGVPARVEISKLTLRGRDYRYLYWLAGVVAAGWIAFGIWFFRAHARALIASLDSQIKNDVPLVAYRQLTLEPHRDKEKASILRYIATHYTDPELDLDAVVTATGTNRKKVNDVLKSELGMTFTSYLNKLRLTEAARLLAEQSETTVAEIALSVGYANVSYFNRLFKEEYGCTPKAIRTLARQPAGLAESAGETVASQDA
jgi:AraC-like DNA-binding protein